MLKFCCKYFFLSHYRSLTNDLDVVNKDTCSAAASTRYIRTLVKDLAGNFGKRWQTAATRRRQQRQYNMKRLCNNAFGLIGQNSAFGAGTHVYPTASLTTRSYTSNVLLDSSWHLYLFSLFLFCSSIQNRERNSACTCMCDLIFYVLNAVKCRLKDTRKDEGKWMMLDQTKCLM